MIQDFVPHPAPDLLETAWPAGIKAVSFDVFDTVVTRHVGDPAAIFLLIGERLREAGLITCSPQAFATHRFNCEKRVRRNKRGREVTLREVYEELTRSMGLDDRLDELMDIEHAVERESIAVIPAMLPVVYRTRERLGGVIFTSDMYLSAGYLTRLLRDMGLFHDSDRLYVSSSFGVQKGDGRLFQVVLQEEGLAPSELLHCGNSLPYDIEPARKLGIRTVHFDLGNPHPSEALLNEHAAQSEGMTAVLAGAARRARLSMLGLQGDQHAIWETGVSVTGPMVYLYALWCIHRARQQGVKRLFFLARDAYLPYLAVRSILEDHPELGIEARYWFGSRQTYYALAIERLDDAEWDHLTTHGRHRYRTLHDLQTCLMARRETMERHLDALGLTADDWDLPLDEQELARFKQMAVEEGSPLNRDLLADIRRCQQLQLRYFMEEGFDPAQPSALVDTGWTTRSHTPLFNFLVSQGCYNLRMYYLGLTVEKTHIPLAAIDTFMFNHAAAQGVSRPGFNYTRPLEELFASDYGRTQGFDERDGRIVPLYAPLEDAGFVEKYFPAYRGGFAAFLRQMKGQPIDIDACHDLPAVAERLIHRFWAEPTKAEAAVWSQLKWEWDPLGRVKYPLSRSYRVSDAWKAFVQKRPPHVYPQFWVGGAKRLTPTPVLGVLRAAIVGRRAIDRVAAMVPKPVREPATRVRRMVFKPNHIKYAVAAQEVARCLATEIPLG